MEVVAEPMGEEMEFLDSEIEHTVRRHVQAPGSIVGNTARRHNARDGGRTARRDDESKGLGEYFRSGRELWEMLGGAPAWRCGCACWAVGWKTLVPGSEINLSRPFRVFC